MTALRRFRILADIPSAREAAKKLGVHESTVGKWESGRGKPKADRLLAIAKLYGCTVDDLLAD